MPSDGHENLTFRARPDRRPIRQSTRSSTLPWLVVAVIAALAFVFVVRALLARTAWTAGASPVPETAQSMPHAAQVHDAARVPDSVGPSEFAPRYVPSVYRCADRAGGVSLQSQPCGPDQRTTRVVAAPLLAPPVRATQPSRPSTYNQPAYNTFHVPQEDSLAPRRAACATARQQREDTLERVGLKRNYDLLQRLDAMVNRACKGL